MSVSPAQAIKVGSYILKKQLSGKKYPLVLMLEPLFRCNLACPGCGKIDYPAEILNQRLSPAQCFEAAEECGAPVVAIAGGEPLLHQEMPEIVNGLLERGKFIYLCTNALLLDKKIELYKPHKNFSWDIHLDGDRAMHDKAVDLEGTFDKAVAAIKKAKSLGFNVSVNCTLFDGVAPERVAAFFDEVTALGIDGIMTSPGYAYERAAEQKYFLNRQKTKKLFRDIFRLGKGKKWKFNQSPIFLDFLAGNQHLECTPWGNPTRNVFGWQRPCYLIGEGYAKTFKELMETTEWDKYGTGNYEKCADCMVHSGYEPTAAALSVLKPWKAVRLSLRGIRTEGPMVPEVSLANQRPAEYVFSNHVEKSLADIKAKNAEEDAKSGEKGSKIRQAS